MMKFGLKPSKDFITECPFYFRDPEQGKTQTLTHVFRTGGGLAIAALRNYKLNLQVVLRRGTGSALVLEEFFMGTFRVVRKASVSIANFDTSYTTVFKICSESSPFFIFYHELHPFVEVRNLITLKVISTCGLEGVFNDLELKSCANQFRASIDVTYISSLGQFAIAVGGTLVLAKDSTVTRIIYDIKSHNIKDRFMNVLYDESTSRLLAMGLTTIMIFQLDCSNVYPAVTLNITSCGRVTRVLGWIPSEHMILFEKATAQFQEIVNIIYYEDPKEPLLATVSVKKPYTSSYCPYKKALFYIDEAAFGRKEIKILPLSDIKKAMGTDENRPEETQALEGDRFAFLPDHFGEIIKIYFYCPRGTLFVKPFR